MSLKTHLDDPASVVRAFFNDNLADTTTIRAHYRSMIEGAVTVLPDDSAARPPWDVLGHAISARLLWELAPAADDIIAGALHADVADHFEDRVTLDQFVAVLGAGSHASTSDDAARVCWIVGVLDRVYRSGRSDDPFLTAIRHAQSLPELLAVAPPVWAADIADTTARCLPLIEGHRGPGVAVGPTFAGSRTVGGADADYLTGDGLLIDIKATKDPRFRLRDLHQVIAYALLDWDNRYGISGVGVLLARQTKLVTWDLDQTLAGMAGSAVDLGELRAGLQAVLSVR